MVDLSTITRSLVIGPSGTISDVNITLDFAKCNSSTNTSGCTFDDSFSPFFDEIFFSLKSPTGTVVDMIPFNSWFAGSSPNFSGAITLDDEAKTPVNIDPNRPFAGTFRPINPLSAFDGQEAQGTWTLTIADDAGGDPLVYRSATLNIAIEEGDQSDTIAWAADGNDLEWGTLFSFGFDADQGPEVRAPALVVSELGPASVEVTLVGFSAGGPGGGNRQNARIVIPLTILLLGAED